MSVPLPQFVSNPWRLLPRASVGCPATTHYFEKNYTLNKNIFLTRHFGPWGTQVRVRSQYPWLSYKILNGVCPLDEKPKTETPTVTKYPVWHDKDPGLLKGHMHRAKAYKGSLLNTSHVNEIFFKS